MEPKLIKAYRNDFPITNRFIYLDHAGVAPLSRRAEQAVQEFARESAEQAAFRYPEWSVKAAAVRTACARLINAAADEIAFVGSTSHGLSIVAQGLRWNSGDNVMVYEREFPSNRYPWERLKSRGVEVRILPSRGGRIAFEDIVRMMDEKTRLLSLSSVQFTNGFRIDLARTGALCRERGALFCVDAIQSLGVLPMDVRAWNIGFLSADAHKWLLGPEGIGIFYCRKELAEELEPPLVGWKSVKSEFNFEQPQYALKNDAQRFEEGALNLTGIFGLGAAVGLLQEAGIAAIEQRVLDLGDLIIAEADRRGFVVKTPKERRDRGGIITVAGAFDPQAVREGLRKQGIMVNVRSGGIRLSPHFYNNEEEILACFKAMDKIMGK